MLNFFGRKKEPTTLFYNTDVHCHILPGVDHGSQNVEQSLAMLQAELDMGITRVICTSHVTSNTFENTPETLNAAYDELKLAVAEAQLPVEIFVSAEYRIDEYWDEQYAAGAVLPMPGNYLLLENSFQQELLELDEMLFNLRIKRYRPILAHPERYSYYARRRQRYEELHQRGVKFQVNILSLAGYFGSTARENAVWLLKHDFVDMLGSDMHNLDHAAIIKEYLSSREWRKKIAPQLEGRLLNDNVK